MILFGNWACHGVPVFKQKTQIITLGLSQKLESPNPILTPNDLTPNDLTNHLPSIQISQIPSKPQSNIWRMSHWYR